MKSFYSTLFIAISLLVNAQSPQGINYQTVVRDGAGSLITNHTIGLKFLLHQGSPTGTVAYAETQSDSTNAFGLISTIIGHGTPVTGSFSSINWAIGSIYLETQIDQNGGTNFLTIGTPQLLMSVPYAFYADSSNEHQQLSISGNQLSISNGNTVTLPNNSSTSSTYFQQTLVGGVGYSFVSSTQEPNANSFLPVFGYNPGNNNNAAYALTAQKDATTGSYIITGTGGYAGQCGGGNGVYITSATTHQGGVFFSYTNGCGHFVATPSGPVTYDVSPSNSNGIIFSDGTYLYVNNNSTNWLAYSVSGSSLTLHNTYTPQSLPGGITSIMCSGTDVFILTSTTLYKYDFNGIQSGSITVYGSPTGLVNIDATKLYLVSSLLTPASSTTFNGALLMTPISKF